MTETNGASLKQMQKIASDRNDRLEGGFAWRMLDLLISFAAIIIFVFAIRATVFEPVRVDGSSMLETLQHNDYLFVEKLSYAFTAPQKGDIVICYYPDEYYASRGVDYKTRVKRVVATEGDTVEARDGKLYVNGLAADEPYLDSARARTERIDTPVTIGKGEVYVLGDNRISSNDSRNELVGPIPIARIVGKAHFVVFPFDHWHGV